MTSSLETLEALLDDKIPQQYREFIERASFDKGLEYAVQAAGRYWTVDDFFMSNSEGRSICDAYMAVRHALPPGSFPILSTLGGYLIVYGTSHNDSNVYYWDHEQQSGADEMTKVADSASTLAAIIVEYDETVGG